MSRLGTFFVTIFISLVFSPFLWGQTCKNNIKVTTPSSDFISNGNGTVTHRPSGLMWKVCSEGQIFSASGCSGEATSLSWSSALNLAESTSFAGFSDWRLPNVKELTSIVELSCYGPSINLEYFLGTPANSYWSSSLAYTNNAYARYVSFLYGHALNEDKSNSLLVRLVRTN